VSDNSQLIRFYAGLGPDSRGRLLSEIQSWPDDKLERTHDYIQWLFPLFERSGFNMQAPILDADTTNQFRSRPDLRRHLRISMDRMLAFYGLEMPSAVPLKAMRAASFAQRSENWLTFSNHNHLRITRILKSLRYLGLDAEAVALFDCLADIYAEESPNERPRISKETFTFWRSAVIR